MAYSRRLTRKRSTLSAESMYLLVVLVAGVITAYWAGHTIGMNLSVITAAASVLGIDQTVTAPPVVGYSQGRAGGSQGAAPYCQTGEVPTFSNGMSTLHAQVGAVMGTPTECEHASSVPGQTIQQTSTGLAAYDGQTNTETFTDGWHHWALTPAGLQTWEGTSAEPPPATG